jgi:hypothetical protein
VNKAQFVPNFEGEFKSFEQWVSKASSWITKDALCVDAKGRICQLGKDFKRAQEERAFPVRFFYDMQVSAEPVPAFEPKIEDTDSARRYLQAFMETHFADRTFGRYIERDLAGDFAYQLARGIGAAIAKSAGRNPTGNAHSALAEAQQFLRTEDTAAEAEQLRQENDRLRAALAQKLVDSTMLTELGIVGNSLNMGLEGGAAHFLAESFGEQFREQGGANYLEARFTTSDGLNLLVTLQNVKGKTPSQYRSEAEAALAKVQTRLNELEAATDEQPVNAARYRFVRTLNAQQFAEIFNENISTGKHFDAIVDERRAQRVDK